MTTKAFAINYNLDKLSDAERTQYLRDLSTFVGLDPNLNAFDTLWMPDGYGRRNLVAYARRGTTEMLRALHGINVILCENHTTSTQAVFIVYGKDKTGRQEVAVGAAPLVGHNDERLSSAIMSANTRANRRLTLQFVGCGVLDESEVQDSTANLASGAKPIGSPIVFPAPQVALNAEPGKDVTPALPIANDPATGGPYIPESSEAFSSRQAKLRADATASLEDPAEQIADIIESSVKKRTRKKRNTVDMSSPGQVSPNADIIESQRTPTSEAVTQVSTPAAPAPVPLPAATVVEAAPTLVQEPVAAKLLPTATAIVGVEVPSNLKDPAFLAQQAQFGEYRKKLSEIAKALIKAGMVPSPGIGGVHTKLRKFAILQSGSEVAEKFTLEQWAELFELFDEFTNDASGLVAYINKAVGA